MRVRITAKPGSKSPGVERGPDGSLVVRVRERAVDGAANEAIIKAIAAHYEVAPSRVRLLRGATSKTKTVEVI